MSKKIVAIAGSPRKKGNSDLIIDSFLKGAADALQETEKIYLRDFNISFCRGCEV